MEFKEKVKNLKMNYEKYTNDYYKNATLVFRLIYDNQIFDRYYETMNEFRSLQSGLYSDNNIDKLLKAKKNKRPLVVSIYRSRALGLLAIVDSIDKLYHNYSTMTTDQIQAYENLVKLKKRIARLAKQSIDSSNELAKKENLDIYDFDIEQKYLQ